MILLVDLIGLAGVSLQHFKVHLATGDNPPPLEAFLDGKFRDWQADQAQRNFQCDQVLSLIHTSADQWLFAGVFAVRGVKPRIVRGRHRFWYDTVELPGLDHLTGRAVVEYRRRFRASYLRGDTCSRDLHVAEIRPHRLTVGDFPGYASARLSHQLLCTIVRDSPAAWVSALSHVAGVYLITDRATGKLYVGSAYGDQGIWQRWQQYARTGHGGNRELRAVLREHGADYRRHFQFALLEICDRQASKEHVVNRECHWKDVMCSREFGYNSN